jgi:hypothetical protein
LVNPGEHVVDQRCRGRAGAQTHAVPPSVGLDERVVVAARNADSRAHVGEQQGGPCPRLELRDALAPERLTIDLDERVASERG